MKKFSKPIALILAGLLTVSLLACQSNASVGDDDEDDEKISETDNNQASGNDLIGMTPSGVRAAMKTQEDMLIIMGMHPSLHEKATYKAILCKDGDLFRLVYEENQEELKETVYDTENAKEYTRSEDTGDSWTVNDSKEEVTLELLLKYMNLEYPPFKQLFDPESYGEYDTKKERYPMKEDVTASIFSDIDDIKGYMESNKDEYTFVLEVEDSTTDTEACYKISVRFGDYTVDLPSVED